MEEFGNDHSINLKDYFEEVISSRILSYRNIVNIVNKFLANYSPTRINNLAITINNQFVYLNKEYKDAGLDFYSSYSGRIIITSFIRIFKEFDEFLTSAVNRGLPKKSAGVLGFLIFIDEYISANEEIFNFNVSNSEKDISDSIDQNISFKYLFTLFMEHCKDVDKSLDAILRFSYLRIQIIRELELLKAYDTIEDVNVAFEELFPINKDLDNLRSKFNDSVIKNKKLVK